MEPVVVSATRCTRPRWGVAPHRDDPRRQSAKRPEPVLRRRSQAVPDARQPHGGGSRERPAGTVAQLAVTPQGRAPAQGLSRRRSPASPTGRSSPRAWPSDSSRPTPPGWSRSCCSSTSTTSRSSTTPSAMPPATNSWRPSVNASRRRCGQATWPPASAATSSRSSSGIRRRCRWRGGSRSASSGHSGPVPIRRARPPTLRSASASRPATRVLVPADELLRNADVAMYSAKARGKNRVAFFEPRDGDGGRRPPHAHRGAPASRRGRVTSSSTTSRSSTWRLAG